MSLLSVGRLDEAAELARRSAANHAALPGWLARRGIALHLVNEAHALAYSGRYGEARQLFEPATERARATNAMGAWVWFEMVLAEIARDTGRATRRSAASAPVRPARPRSSARTRRWSGPTSGSPRATCLLGDCGPAAEALAASRRRRRQPGRHVVRDPRADESVARGLPRRPRRARARLRDVLEVVQRDDVRTFESAVLNDLVRLGVPRRPSTGWMSSPASSTVRSCRPTAATPTPSSERDAVALQVVVDDYEALDVLALAAEAAAELGELLQRRR